MDLWRSLSGMVEVMLTSADISGALRRINDAGIPIFGLVKVDDLTVRFRLRRRDHRKIKALTEGRGERLRIGKRRGSYWTLRRLFRRPVLLAGLLLILFLSLWVPSRVLFVQIEGNSSISSRRILEAAQECGLCFGAQRRQVRSEKMKNALLEEIPELQWAGINTTGCTAVISVRERTAPEKQTQEPCVSSIIAASDGVICEMTVTKGTSLCKVGQAVRVGQVLVSGYTDCGIAIRAEQAQAEIYAQTNRELTASMPAEYAQKGQILRTVKKYSLIIGKKRINFSKGSGILDTTCDKMYVETYMLLPGGFQLPVALVTEQWSVREENAALTDDKSAERALMAFTDQYLKEHMTAGRILNRKESLLTSEGVFCLKGKYDCIEMIGTTRIEENLPNYAEAD